MQGFPPKLGKDSHVYWKTIQLSTYLNYFQKETFTNSALLFQSPPGVTTSAVAKRLPPTQYDAVISDAARVAISFLLR